MRKESRALDLIESYVGEVARRLPRRQRQDVRQELRSSLHDSLESRAAGELSEEDASALLREMGPPWAVAASYRPQDQYLIGPDLFPTFRQVLAIVVPVLATVITGASLLGLAVEGGGGPGFGTWFFGLLDALVQVSLLSLGVIVVIFYVLQRKDVDASREEEWDPGDLPPVTSFQDVKRGEAIAGVVIPAIVLALLHLYRDRIGLHLQPSVMEGPLLNHVLQDNLLWIDAALLLGMGLNTFLLWRGRWSWTTRLANFHFDVFGVYVFYRVAADFADEEATMLAAGIPERVVELLVQGAWLLVIGAAVVVAAETGLALYRQLRCRTGTSPGRLAA